MSLCGNGSLAGYLRRARGQIRHLNLLPTRRLVKVLRTTLRIAHKLDGERTASELGQMLRRRAVRCARWCWVCVVIVRPWRGSSFARRRWGVARWRR